MHEQAIDVNEFPFSCPLASHINGVSRSPLSTTVCLVFPGLRRLPSGFFLCIGVASDELRNTVIPCMGPVSLLRLRYTKRAMSPTSFPAPSCHSRKVNPQISFVECSQSTLSISTMDSTPRSSSSNIPCDLLKASKLAATTAKMDQMVKFLYVPSGSSAVWGRTTRIFCAGFEDLYKMVTI